MIRSGLAAISGALTTGTALAGSSGAGVSRFLSSLLPVLALSPIPFFLEFISTPSQLFS
jgi:hypothetical protein